MDSRSFASWEREPVCTSNGGWVGGGGGVSESGSLMGGDWSRALHGSEKDRITGAGPSLVSEED